MTRIEQLIVFFSRWGKKLIIKNSSIAFNDTNEIFCFTTNMMKFYKEMCALFSEVEQMDEPFPIYYNGEEGLGVRSDCKIFFNGKFYKYGDKIGGENEN